MDTLREAGHTTSVVIPDASRSWIGKAHIIGDTLKATYVCPDTHLEDDTVDQPSDRHSHEDDDWVLVNGTPASCTQLGLFNLFPDRGPVDLVISGPNHGRNASTIYNLSSGTVGGALEAATCGKKAIALSFASKDHQPPEIINAASRLAVQIIEYLFHHWAAAEGVELYNLNIPMLHDVEQRPILYSSALQNYWSKGSLFQPLPVNDAAKMNGAIPNGPTEVAKRPFGREKYFAWAPELSDIKRSVEQSAEGTDTWTVREGCSR